MTILGYLIPRCGHFYAKNRNIVKYNFIGTVKVDMNITPVVVIFLPN